MNPIISLEINNFKIGATASSLINTPIIGLTIPNVRTSSGDYSGRSGGWVDGQFYSKREIVIRGVLRGCGQTVMDELNDLQNSLPINQLLPLFIRTKYGNYLAEVYFTNLNIKFNSFKWLEYELTLVAPEPYLYSTGDGIDPDSGWINFVIQKAIGGGYITPYVLPVVWEAGTQPNIINNVGAEVLPQIILNGKWTNPVITNLTTNKFIKLNLTSAVGDKIIIDMRERTITLNDGSILPYRDSNSDWWAIANGLNVIEVTSSSQTDTSEAIIRYREQYLGIGANI